MHHDDERDMDRIVDIMDGEDHGLLNGVLSSLHFMQAFSKVLDLF